MTEKTYHKITKKPIFRGFRLFKQKYLTKQALFALLAKMRIVIEVKDTISTRFYHKLLDKVSVKSDRIYTPRGIFNISYCASAIQNRRVWYYKSRFSDKVLYDVLDHSTYTVIATVHSECEEFEVRLTPFNHTRVKAGSRQTTVTVFREPKVDFSKQPDPLMQEGAIKAQHFPINFLNARIRVSVSCEADILSGLEVAIDECVNKATAQIRNYIENNSDEINEKLTGVKADGEFVSPDGQRLIPNHICSRCGLPVFKSSVEGYTAQCISCDEDFYAFEIRRLDPKFYLQILRDNAEVISYILSSKKTEEST